MPRVAVKQFKLEYEAFGPEHGPVILLIMGLGGQLLMWPESFCEALASAGYRVIRFDNRDVGLSDKQATTIKPKLLRAGIASVLGLAVHAPYTLDDMASDAIGLLDVLKIQHAHVVGVSMGGMIAQLVALQQPERVSSLTLWMTSSGNPRLPGPSLKLQLRMVRRPERNDAEAVIRHSMRTWRLIGSPGYPVPEDELRAQVERLYLRQHYPRGVARQTLAILAASSRAKRLSGLRLPVQVIHGDADPLIPVAAAHELAALIPGAKLHILAGMGHDLPTPLLPQLAALVLAHVQIADGDAQKKRPRSAGARLPELSEIS